MMIFTEEELSHIDAEAELIKRYPVNNREIRTTGQIPDQDVDYFGGCPICHGCDGQINRDRTHIHICVLHRKAWLIGWNLFTVSYELRCDMEFQAIQHAMLQLFERVDPYHAPCPEIEDRPATPLPESNSAGVYSDDFVF